MKFVNRTTGITVNVSSKGLKKTVSHMPDAKPLKALAKLPELLKGASYDHSVVPQNLAANVRQFHVFRSAANLEGILHDVKIVVREDNNGHWFYDQQLTEQKRPV